MKFKTKVIGTAISIMMLFSLVYAAVVLKENRDYTIAREKVLQLEIFTKNINAAESSIINSGYQGHRDSVRKNILFYYMRENISSNYAIYENGHEIHNNTNLDYTYEDSNLETANGIAQILTVGDKNILILFIKLEFWEKSYMVYQSIDITDVYDTNQLLFVRGLGLAVLFCLMAAGVLYPIIYRILTPFYRLKHAAEEIGRGDFTKRTNIRSRDEVGALSVQFDLMAEKIAEKVNSLTELYERQNLMIGSIGHELKTPMTVIIGYSDSLLRLKMTAKQQEKSLQFIRRECQRLSVLSAKIMALSELSQEQGDLEKKCLSLVVLLLHAQEATAEKQQQKQLHLDIQNEASEEEIEIWGDESLLLSLLINLIDNAIKASEPNSTIIVRFTKNLIEIIDQGIGIPPAELSRVTEPFYMVDKSRSRKQGGSGLGLSLCQQIANYHQIELKIDSHINIGTTVSLLF
jgi:signal transduction histidine kinase